MDCPEPLTPMVAEVSHVDGVTHVNSRTANPVKRDLSAVYTKIITDSLLMRTGSVEMANLATGPRLLSYRVMHRIPAHQRPRIFEDSPLCYDHINAEVVSLYESNVAAGASSLEDISAEALLYSVADVNLDGTVNQDDIGIMLADWGTYEERSDANRDGYVDGADLGVLFMYWGG